jgi:DUF1365 family protein
VSAAPRPEPSTPEGAQALIGFGPVRHVRLKPKRHAFAYSHYFWMLPMRELARQPQSVVNRQRWGLLSFHDADHGEGGPDALAWLDGVLAQSGLDAAELAQPVSFWWVHRADRSLAAVVAEVNNTFGERHAYVLSGPGLKLGSEVTARKVFHVSPFCDVSGRYRFRFMRTGAWGAGAPEAADRLIACVNHDDEAGPLLLTSQAGTLEPLTPASARHAFWGWPLMTWGVVARIHWQALRVWIKGVPLRRKPEPPPHLLSQGEPL